MQIIETNNIPIFSWVTDCEEGALDQARNMAQLPFAFDHVALMPDCHQGYGMPIGGVLATEDVVIPNAVGVDIGCLDKDTEFLSPNGWVKISDYNNEQVLQYNKETDTCNFINPDRFIKQDCTEFYKLYSKYGLDQVVSAEHKVLVWKGVKNRGYKLTDYTAEALVNKHNSLIKGIQGGIKTTFNYTSNNMLSFSDELLKVIIMVSADGHIRKNGNIELHFSKERKINRAQFLLNEANILYTVNKGKDDTTYIYFKDSRITKDLTIFWKANSRQLKILADECLNWDGHIGKRSFYSTSIKEHADIIQYAFTVSGIRAGIFKKEYSNKWKTIYEVYTTNNNIVGFPAKKFEKVKSLDGKKYCFTVPTGYFIIRRNNKISITGNCGMRSYNTGLKCEDIEPYLKTIMGQICEEIPMGFNIHEDEQPDGNLFGIIENNDFICKQQEKRAKRSIGTLGGGNHFIEFQVDQLDYVYVMTHSGSRNLGKQVADHYNKLAKEVGIVIDPKFQLAGLKADSVADQNYLYEMQVCLGFAFINRLSMMNKIRNILNKVGLIVYNGACDLDVHHNYVRLEMHYNKEVWVHRKGATSAANKELGIIPGSQGSASYIVEGFGNHYSFCSCSHGAGRKMSRTKAKKNLDLQKEIDTLNAKGVLHAIRTQKDLDEAPSAYKDISTVMENQKDLVRIVKEFKPIAVLKG